MSKNSSKIKWLFWIDSDVLITDGHNNPEHNWVADVIDMFGQGEQCGSGDRPTSPQSSVDLIIADQRDSSFGDVNAGTIIFRVAQWSIDFLEAWWNHALAQQVRRPRFSSGWTFGIIHLR
jgi:hypothetical protein